MKRAGFLNLPKNSLLSLISLFCAGAVLAAGTVSPEEGNPAGTAYRKNDITDARFGDGNIKDLLKKAYGLRDKIHQTVIGQDRAARILQDRLIQYLENFGTRTKDPIAMHLIGLPGVGKSSILDALEGLGLRIIRVDAQNFAGAGISNEMGSLYTQLNLAANAKVPTLVLFDEIDKIPEIIAKDGKIEEQTQPLIGLINSILSEGRVQNGILQNQDLSNIFVMTAMNFAPSEMEAFSQEALGTHKNFYDFTIQDFDSFDSWIRSNPNARAKVLSHLFRSNTVSRIAPNAVVVKPLNEENYREIAKNNIDSTIKKVAGDPNEKKRISVKYSDKYVDFIAKSTVFPPSGARDTIFKSNALTEQLILYGTKAAPEGTQSLNRPREISIDVTDRGEVQVTVIPKLRDVRGRKTDGVPFTFPVEFDPEDRTFYRPNFVTAIAPEKVLNDSNAPAKLTRKEVRQTRFPPGSDVAKGLAKKIDQVVIGQEPYTRHLEKELGTYLSMTGPVSKSPPFTVLAGFPGIGKSEMVAVAAKELNLPVVRINLQKYATDASDSGDRLLIDLSQQISLARTKRPDRKYILQLEELDKIFEIEPGTGRFVNRPAMTVIKDLLNDGRIVSRATVGNTIHNIDVDVRDAYTAVTMNFAVDRFGFKADPRLTTIEDVQRAWRKLSTRPADLKSVLGTMFLPETVNRLMPMVKIVKPLDRESYERIIGLQIGVAAKDRLIDPKTGVNKGEIELALSPTYRKYLYNETVIPSEGARYTAVSSRSKISTDLEDSLRHLPRSSKLATQPLLVTLDYDPEKNVVSAIARSTKPGSTLPPKKIFENTVTLSFPPIHMQGPISDTRALVAVHEFGHAMTGIRLGKRFEYATVIPPQNGIGGYVKFLESPTMRAKDLVSTIYSALGSRAMERIFLSDNPLSSKSVIQISTGSSGDIVQATQNLWGLVYEIGLDPDGGTIERKGYSGPARYATFADLPAEKVDALAHVLRDMEDHLVADFLKAHPRSWYLDKITEFARAGGLDEKQFYELIGFPHPGKNALPVSASNALRDHFGDRLEKPSAAWKKAASFKQGATRTTALENLELATQVLIDSLKERLHSPAKGLAAVNQNEVMPGACVTENVKNALKKL